MNRNHWTTPSFTELRMDAEIGAYQDDFGPPGEGPEVLRRRSRAATRPRLVMAALALFGATGCAVEHTSAESVDRQTSALAKRSKLLDSDYDGDGKSDIAVWGQVDATWYIRYSSGLAPATVAWGTIQDSRPVAGDYDGDGKTDIAVYSNWSATWHIKYSSGLAPVSIEWGQKYVSMPAPGDYDGDGKTDLAVYVVGTVDGFPYDTWFIKYSSGLPFAAVTWGNSNSLPVPGDYDGDGKTDIAVWDYSTAIWRIRYSSGATPTVVTWGTPGAIGTTTPVPGDYDGDGKTDIAIWDNSRATWYVQFSSGKAPAAVQWGTSGDSVPIARDYDGDGTTDLAVWNNSNATWYFEYSSGAAPAAVAWEMTSLPVPLPHRPGLCVGLPEPAAGPCWWYDP